MFEKAAMKFLASVVANGLATSPVLDYPVDQQRLPKGLIMFDTIKIEYPDTRS